MEFVECCQVVCFSVNVHMPKDRITHSCQSCSCVEFVECCQVVCFSVNVHMPKDRVTQSHQGYGFVEFLGEEDADYAIKIMNMIKLYGKPVRVNKVGGNPA